MSALDRTPLNTNYLQPTKFLLSFDRITTTQYFCQSANIPGMSLPSITVNTPGFDYHAVGDKMQYNEFRIKFNINEDLLSWKEIHNWFRSIASPEGTSERNRLTDIQSKKTSFKNYSDATLTALSALNNVTLNVRFFNLFPISLSDINFDTASSANEIMTGEAVFMYDYFNFN